MNQRNHHDYYVARAMSSHELAQRAEDPAIAAIHADFAARYERLANEPEEDAPPRSPARTA